MTYSLLIPICEGSGVCLAACECDCREPVFSHRGDVLDAYAGNPAVMRLDKVIAYPTCISFSHTLFQSTAAALPIIPTDVTPTKRVLTEPVTEQAILLPQSCLT